MVLGILNASNGSSGQTLCHFAMIVLAEGFPTPPGLTNVAFLNEICVVENTGLVYAAGTDNRAAVIDPNTNAIVAVVVFRTSGGGIDLTLVNQSTGMVYLRQPNSNIVVIDGRPSSSTFTLAVPMGLRFLSVDPAVLRVYGSGALNDEKGGVVVIADANPPVTKNDCKNGGWQVRTNGLGQPFPNQGQCIQYFNIGK